MMLQNFVNHFKRKKNQVKNYNYYCYYEYKLSFLCTLKFFTETPFFVVAVTFVFLCFSNSMSAIALPQTLIHSFTISCSNDCCVLVSPMPSTHMDQILTTSSSLHTISCKASNSFESVPVKAS